MSYLNYQGFNVYYEVYGGEDKKPLLLLNGIMMSTVSWEEFIEPLSANNRLILMDFIDQGKSSKMTGGALTQVMQVEVVRALLDLLHVEKASIMGYSYGGEIALQFSIQYPQRVERMVLFDTAAATRPWLRDVGNSWNMAAVEGETFYLTTIPIIYSPEFYNRENEWMERRREALRPLFHHPAFWGSMIQLTNSAATHDVREHLGEITAPTLVVSGQQDQLIPVDEQIYLVKHIPNSHHIIIPDCGHASMYERPLLFATLILGFVNNSKLEYHIK